MCMRAVLICARAKNETLGPSRAPPQVKDRKYLVDVDALRSETAQPSP